MKKRDGIAHRMDAADFVGIDGVIGTDCDATAFPAGDDEHFGFVIEAAGATENFRNEYRDAACETRIAYREFAVRRRG